MGALTSAKETVSRPLALALASLAVALALAHFSSAEITSLVGDDGGITLRYAERIARGCGFNYNDGEAVNGSSNPLFTLLLAAALSMGVGPTSAIFALGYGCLIVAVGSLVYAYCRYYSFGAALFALTALVVQPTRFASLLNGLESPLTIALCCALFHACHARRPTYQGVCLGLLVASKLDGAAAALAFAIAYTTFHKRYPWRVSLVALLTSVPVLTTLFLSFGSVLPNSLVSKLHHPTRGGFDPLWLVRLLYDQNKTGGLIYLGLASFVLTLRPTTRSFALSVVLLWFGIHTLVYSCVDLGAPFPWYAVAPAALLVPMAANLVHHLTGLATMFWPERMRTGIQVAAIGAFCVIAFLPTARRQHNPPVSGDWLPPWVEGDLARQAAGAWLRKYTTTQELLVSPWGLPAFEYEGPVYDPSWLNSRIDEDRERSGKYALECVPAGTAPKDSRFGLKLVALFRYGTASDGYSVYARHDSEIVRNRLTFLRPTEARTNTEPLRPADFKLMFARASRRIENAAAVR